MTGTKCLKNYPVIEQHGAIFIWFGIDANEQPAPLEFPEQLASEEWSAFLCQADWKVNHQYAIDNVMDQCMVVIYMRHRTRWQMVIVPQR